MLPLVLCLLFPQYHLRLEELHFLPFSSSSFVLGWFAATLSETAPPETCVAFELPFSLDRICGLAQSLKRTCIGDPEPPTGAFAASPEFCKGQEGCQLALLTRAFPRNNRETPPDRLTADIGSLWTKEGAPTPSILSEQEAEPPELETVDSLAGKHGARTAVRGIIGTLGIGTGANRGYIR